MQASTLVREFSWNGVKICDPGRHLALEEVRAVLATIYPDIATATITGPEAVGDKLLYRLVASIEIQGAFAFFFRLGFQAFSL